MTSHAEAAKMIRTILKESFPGVKFSVRSQSYTGGSSIRVEWIDGPKSEEVDQLVGKFEYGHFDGMDDSYHYSNVGAAPAQVKFVFCERELSFEHAQSLAEEVNRLLGVDIKVVKTERGWEVADNFWIESVLCNVYSAIRRQSVGKLVA